MNHFRFTVSLRLWHPSIDPDDVSRELGLNPERKWKAGENRATPQGQALTGVYRESYWVSPVAYKRGVSLPDVLDQDLCRLESHRSFLTRFFETGGTIEYFIGWFTENNAGAVFNCQLLKRLAALNIDLDMDFYGGPDPADLGVCSPPRTGVDLTR